LVGDQWTKPEQTAENPKTGERAYLVGNQWEVFKPPSVEKPKASTASNLSGPVEGVDSPMGEDFGSAIMGQSTPKKESVLQQQPMPEPLPTEDRAVLNPKFTNAIQAKLNSLPEEERTAALETLTKRGDVYGRAARAIAGRYDSLNKIQTPTGQKFDPRLEAQQERFMKQGMSPEVAEQAAIRQAESGQFMPDYAQMTETPEEVIKAQEEYGFRKDMTPIEETLRTLKRTGAKGVTAGEQGYRGAKQFVADSLGIDAPDNKQRLNELNGLMQNMGESKYKPIQILENAGASIIQQAPAMIAGAFTGATPLVFGSMFAQSFGQTYDESRRLGLDVRESAARSAAFAAFEVLGEKVGFGAEMKALRKTAQNIPLSELTGYYAKALAKQIPGEEFTYTGQTIVDKAHGLNKEAGIKEFLDGAVDTMLATVAQGGMMLAGGAAANKALGRFRRPATNETENTKVGGKSINDIIKNIDALTAEEEARTEREAIQAPPVEENPLEGPEPPDIFGEQNVRQPIRGTSGEGVGVASKPSADIPTTAGVEGSGAAGVVPTGEVTTRPDSGKTTQPTTLEAYEITDPKQTPMFKYITGINKTLDTFYNQLYTNNHDQLPDDLRTTRFILDGVNDAMRMVQTRLAAWDHPAIAGATESERRMGKARATAEDRELLGAASNLSAIGTRIANQSMALYKGYKGKKAGSQEKINASEKELEKEFHRALDLMHARGLLNEEESKEWEVMKAARPKQETPPAQELFTPEEPAPTPEEPPKDLVKKYQEQGFAPDDAKREAAVEAGVNPEQPAPYFGSDEINALGDKIKDAINTITNDFMVGDMVRYGNTTGTVVGTDATHVKLHPDGAKSPKAFYRVPKARIELVARPDTVSKSAAMAMSGEDKKFGTEQGRLDADLGGLARLLGQNMYASAIAEVSIKELLQNSFDAVKGAVSSKNSPSLYKVGEIVITLDEENRTITVQDNARGMTPSIVRDAFFTIAGSDKSDLDPSERSGGFGLAKMGFMIGTDRLILDTVRDGVRITVDTTAKDILDNNFKINKKAAPKGEHGTTVTVKIPEYYIDPKNGEKKDIYFDSDPKYSTPLKKPLIGPVIVKTVQKSAFRNEEKTLPVGVNFPLDKYIPLKVNFSWGSADVYFGKDRITREYDTKHEVLSGGVYQFDGRGKYQTHFKLSESEIIPFNLIINVKPNVEAKHPDYPFENSRERFKDRLKEDVDSLVSYLAQIARGNEAADLQDNFKNIVSMPRVDVGQDITDVTNKLQKSFDRRGKVERRELPPMPSEVRVEGTRVISVDTGKTITDTAKEKEKQTKGTFQADQAAPEMKDFLLNMAQNPNQPIFHNNTNVDFLEVGRQYGNPEMFFAELGTVMVEMKEALANSGFYNYEQLKPENLFFGGVSIDKGYGGVHIKVPYKAVLINPFYDFGAKTLFGAREYLWETMTHEMAHTGDMGHGVGHNTHMLKVRQYLADEGLADYFRDALMEILTKHESAFTAMREAYGKSTTKNTAKSLEDYGKGSASISDGSARSSGDDTVDALSARERSGGDGDIRPASGGNQTSEVGGRDRTPSSVKGLHPSVVAAINNNDIKGALRALAKNTSGLYAELASRLAELDLPTSISFNNARNLLRQHIDNKTAQQQVRLFTYIRRAYPELYEKHFKDYDKADSLENVYKGLQELASPKYDTSYVKTELDTLKGVFDKSMPGLTAPGFFVPDIDAITINPSSAFGTDNRVLLHEIVHAATEFTLRDTAGLSDRQKKAVTSLYDMYNKAQETMSPKEYGFTNIFEFVAEALTNPKFQAKLKSIQYKSQKASMWNSLLKFITQMFGKDNIAASAMIEANEIFSAHRPVGAVSGIRFAPRIKGPVSKPDTWRTAETVEHSLRQIGKDIFTGKMTIEDAIKDIGAAFYDQNGFRYRAALLPIMQIRQLQDMTKNVFPQLGGAVRTVENMISYRGRKLRIAGDITKDALDLQRRSPERSMLLGKLMIEATIRKLDVDPLSRNYDPIKINAELKDAWNALGPKFQSMYRRVRNYSTDNIHETIREMKSRALLLPKAERQKIIKEINRQFGPDKLVEPYFALRRFGDFYFQVGKGNNKEFYTFQNSFDRTLAMENRKRELSQGNALQRALVETVYPGNGISEIFSKNLATTAALKEVHDLIDNVSSSSVADIKKDLKSSLDQLIYVMLPQQSVRKMFINRKSIQGASEDWIRVFADTAVHTAYQQARFKFAEQYKNGVQDAYDHLNDLREAGANPNRIAAYRDFVNEVDRRYNNVFGVEDKSAWAKTVGNIMSTTFYFMLSGPASAFTNTIGATITTMPYIGSRYGYAKTNGILLKNLAKYMASTPKRTLLPLVTGNFYGVSFPSIVESTISNPLLRRAADRFVDDGDINISIHNDVFDLGDAPSALYTGRLNSVKKVAAGAFHQLERFNRENTLMTTFELAYKEFNGNIKKNAQGVAQKDSNGNPLRYTADEAFEEAILEAKDMAGLTLGDPTRALRGRIFANPTFSALTQFKQYAVTTLYMVGRNIQQSFAPFSKGEIEDLKKMYTKDGLPPQEIEQRIKETQDYNDELRAEAMKRFAGMTGMALLWGGIAASPFFSLLGLILQALNAIGGDDKDEFYDWENSFYNYMENEFGGWAGASLAKLGMEEKNAKATGRKIGEAAGRGVVPTITGASLSDRVSIDPVNMLFRESRYSPDARDAVIEAFISNAGPSAGLGLNWADAVQMAQRGQYERAFEMALPALLANPLKAHRISKEGLTNRKGEVLGGIYADELTQWEIALQAVGFQPERIAQAQKSIIATQTKQQKINDKRNALMDRIWMDREAPESFETALDKVREFNIKYPDKKISPKDIKDSFDARAKHKAEVEAIGANVEKKLRGRLEPMLEYGQK